MAKSLHTHRGTCQRCGRAQAIDNATGRIAKHGYTVDYGYFNGVCLGSGHEPAEVSVKMTRETMAEVLKEAKRLDKHAAALKSGEVVPATFERWNRDKVKVEVSRTWGRRETRGDYDTLPIEQATPDERASAIRGAISFTEQQARMLRAHEQFLREAVLPRHGKPLFDVKRETVKHFRVGDTVKHKGEAYVLLAERMSMSFTGNGRLLGYWVARANDATKRRCGALSLKEIRAEN